MERKDDEPVVFYNDHFRKNMLPDELYFLDRNMYVDNVVYYTPVKITDKYLKEMRVVIEDEAAQTMRDAQAQIDLSIADLKTHEDLHIQLVAEQAKFTERVRYAQEEHRRITESLATSRGTTQPQKATQRSLPTTPPGETLIGIAKTLLSKEAYKRYVEPHIADIQYEHADAMLEGKVWKARYRLMRGYAFWLIPVAYGLWKKLLPLWNWASK